MNKDILFFIENISFNHWPFSTIWSIYLVMWPTTCPFHRFYSPTQIQNEIFLFHPDANLLIDLNWSKTTKSARSAKVGGPECQNRFVFRHQSERFGKITVTSRKHESGRTFKPSIFIQMTAHFIGTVHFDPFNCLLLPDGTLWTSFCS